VFAELATFSGPWILEATPPMSQLYNLAVYGGSTKMLWTPECIPIPSSPLLWRGTPEEKPTPWTFWESERAVLLTLRASVVHPACCYYSTQKGSQACVLQHSLQHQPGYHMDRLLLLLFSQSDLPSPPPSAPRRLIKC